MLKTRLLFDLTLDVSPAHDLRTEAGYGRLVYHVTGGNFRGDRLNGRVLPVSGDWVSVRPDHGKIDVRLMLETDDGASIYMRYEGINTLGPQHREQLAKGLPLDPASYYFRTAPFFETSVPRYDWLNKVVSVGIGERISTGVNYTVYEVT